MTKETEVKKEYLNKFRESKEALERIRDQISEIELHETLPKTGDMDIGMRGSSIQRDLSDYAAKKDDLVGKMIQAGSRQIKTHTDIFQAVEDVPDEKERQVLTLRYIKCLKWEEIAVEMHVEWAQIHRIHAKALKHFKIPEKNT